VGEDPHPQQLPGDRIAEEASYADQKLFEERIQFPGIPL
jgi:hypothetical protein